MLKRVHTGGWMLVSAVAGLVLLTFAFFDDSSSAGKVEKPAIPPVATAECVAEDSCSAVSLRLQVGQSRMTVLEANATTGYIWQLESALPAGSPVQAELSMVSDCEEGCCGLPTPTTVTITGVKPGKVRLRLVYVRPWEKDRTPAREEEFCIEVLPAQP